MPAAVAKPAPARGRSAAPVLTAIALALLLVGLGVVWYQQMQFEQEAAPRSDVGALREQVRTLQQRLAVLEQRPVAAVVAPVAATPVARAVLPVDLGPLEARVVALEQRPVAALPDPALAGRLAALDQRLGQAVQRAERLAALRHAAVALEAGRPLGDIGAAAPALLRYASVAPPTEAGLRAAFDEAAARARAASRTTEEAGIGARLWARLRSLVTVRSGDTVLVGSPAATVLGHAAARLAAADLAGAVAALDALDPAAAAAMAGWRAEAAALLAARTALADMMAG